jgi:adenosylcobyric acid synthase
MANIMIQGTTSSAGKSLMCTGLCKIFKEDGYKVFPFKSQNMSSIYYTTKEGFKISTAQALQAMAAGLEPHPDMNPILLLPKTDMGSMVVLNGEDYKHMEAVEYFKYKTTLRPMIVEVFSKVESENEIVVIEGAGSPAEIKQNDIVNMGMAEIADAPVLLVADIDRGGVFASLYGTVMLLEEHERKRIKGLIINKFRGDKTLLDPGIKMIEDILNIPVIGTIPFTHLELVDEDTLIDYEKQCNKTAQTKEQMDQELDKLAKVLRENLDMDLVYSLLGINR